MRPQAKRILVPPSRPIGAAARLRVRVAFDIAASDRHRRRAVPLRETMPPSPRVLFCALAILFAGCGDDTNTNPSDAGFDAPGADALTPPPVPITTSLGTVLGVRGEGFLGFLGIPYAEPPIGDLRFRSPVRKTPWTEPRDATRRGRACAQSALGLRIGDEDCLSLNVHTPDPMPVGAPVIVWIHGGAFVFGEGAQTDNGTLGDLLASREGVVVVSMNYRLGNFGWLTHSGIGARGNQGFEDQQLALEWVRDNIAAFGGDPNNVTIAGESAGGLSVCLHLIAPRSRGLFHRAIAQSGLCESFLPTIADSQAYADRVVESVGCSAAPDVGVCLRAVSTNRIRDAGGFTGEILPIVAGSDRATWPTADGTVIPGGFRERVEAGEMADVPVILGWNRDEGTLFLALSVLSGTVLDEATYHATIAALGATYGIDPLVIEAQYPLSAYPDAAAALAAPVGDVSIACPQRRAALLLAARGVEVHTYHFEYPDARFVLMPANELGAFHSAEIQFVFGHPVSAPTYPDEAGAALALSMQGYWTSFARTGDPNVVGAVPWPPFAATTEPTLVLDRTISAGAAVSRDACVLWDAHPTP